MDSCTREDYPHKGGGRRAGPLAGWPAGSPRVKRRISAAISIHSNRVIIRHPGLSKTNLPLASIHHKAMHARRTLLGSEAWPMYITRDAMHRFSHSQAHPNTCQVLDQGGMWGMGGTACWSSRGEGRHRGTPRVSSFHAGARSHPITDTRDQTWSSAAASDPLALGIRGLPSTARRLLQARDCP